jgi:hypothetical protein
LPRGAVARPDEDAATSGVAYFVDDHLVARVYWHDSGAIERDTRFDADGRMHGPEREYHLDGALAYRARWVHGRQHGWQEQWDERGRLLVRTRFVRGTGLDAWFTLGRLSETRACVDGDRHGFERWWSTRRTIWSEAHYVAGREHGVFREWRDTATNTATASLRRGFPHFWIHGTRVTRRAYTRALATDATLPPLDARDDSPRRTAPRVIERP